MPCRAGAAFCRYEHLGIEEAVIKSVTETAKICAVTERLETMSQPEQRPVGIVTTAYMDLGGSAWAIFAIDSGRYPRLTASIAAGTLKCVSLTSYVNNTIVVPLELSLCTYPARPKSHITWKTQSAERAVAYKLRRAGWPKGPTMEISAPATESPFKKALETLSPENRALIEARFSEVMGKLETEEQAGAQMKTRMDSMVVASQADRKMLEDQIAIFMKGPGANYAAPYSLETCAQALLTSDNADEVRRAVDRMITVANRSHVDRLGPVRRETGGEAPAKRARTPEVKVTAAPPKESVDSRSPLQRAFAATFE